MIDVLIVDDSLTAREFIKHIFANDPEIRIIGEAKNGAEALRFVEKRRPDVVVMDIRMPGMNGYETTRAMMEICPVPIVIHSSLATPGQNDIVFQAMNAGAVAVSQKPSGPGHPESRQMAEKLIRTVKLMSEIKVVRKFKPRHRQAQMPGPMAPTTGPQIDVIGIGASTGGPPVIQALLSSLSPHFRIPIIIVQHITAGFLSGMVSWLSKHTPMTLSIPHTGQAISEGHIYFAPEDHHLEVTPTRHFLVRPIAPGIALKRPITHLFQTMAQVFGNTAAGVLLTGMGNDGALGLKEMKRHGAVTLVQNRETAVVFGMPHEAIKLDAATFVLSPPEIASYLNLLARNSLPLS